MVIEPSFDLAWEFSEGKALVVIEARKGSSTGAGESSSLRSNEDAWRYSEGLAPVKTGNKWGFIDETGDMVIQPGFDDAWWFSEEMAPVRVGGKWGYIDTKGKLVIEPRFDTAYRFSQVGLWCGWVISRATSTSPAKPWWHPSISSLGRLWATGLSSATTGWRNNIDRSGEKVWGAETVVNRPEWRPRAWRPCRPLGRQPRRIPHRFDRLRWRLAHHRTQATDPYPSQLMRMWAAECGGGTWEWGARCGRHAGRRSGTGRHEIRFRRGHNVVVLWGGRTTWLCACARRRRYWR